MKNMPSRASVRRCSTSAPVTLSSPPWMSISTGKESISPFSACTTRNRCTTTEEATAATRRFLVISWTNNFDANIVYNFSKWRHNYRLRSRRHGLHLHVKWKRELAAVHGGICHAGANGSIRLHVCVDEN